MNIVLDWLVDNHKAASERAWKQSSLTVSDSLLFQSCGVKVHIIREDRFIIYVHIDGKLVEKIDIWSVLKDQAMFRLHVIADKPNIKFIRESMFKTKLVLTCWLSVTEFIIHHDQIAVISDFFIPNKQ